MSWVRYFLFYILGLNMAVSYFFFYFFFFTFFTFRVTGPLYLNFFVWPFQLTFLVCFIFFFFHFFNGPVFYLSVILFFILKLAHSIFLLIRDVCWKNWPSLNGSGNASAPSVHNYIKFARKQRMNGLKQNTLFPHTLLPWRPDTLQLSSSYNLPSFNFIAGEHVTSIHNFVRMFPHHWAYPKLD